MNESEYVLLDKLLHGYCKREMLFIKLAKTFAKYALLAKDTHTAKEMIEIATDSMKILEETIHTRDRYQIFYKFKKPGEQNLI